MPKEKNITKKQQIRNDIIMICAIFVIIAIALAVYLITRSEGNTVTVQIGNDIHSSYPLDCDTVVTLYSEDSEQFNVMVISNGKVSISDASCPDLICAHHRPIENGGDTIVCLPNKVIVTIE